VIGDTALQQAFDSLSARFSNNVTDKENTHPFACHKETRNPKHEIRNNYQCSKYQ
jgi:hypothetical protein